MPTYSVSRTFPWKGRITEKVATVMRMFGLTTERLTDQAVTHHCTIDIRPGDVVCITGPSGSGKSVILRELEKRIPASDRINIDRIDLPPNKALIDCVSGDFLAGLRMLSKAGLNDVFCVLNQPAHLSDGQKYRFRLAMALASGRRFVFADEFCSNLDRITAAVIACNIHKFAKQAGVTLILATSCDDILLDLEPDVLIVKQLSGPAEVTYKQKRQ
jgi:ABC-type ATPase with predicted acetyltransferase domain